MNKAKRVDEAATAIGELIEELQYIQCLVDYQELIDELELQSGTIETILNNLRKEN